MFQMKVATTASRTGGLELSFLVCTLQVAKAAAECSESQMTQSMGGRLSQLSQLTHLTEFVSVLPMSQ